jgi:hypothetical protein
MAVARDNAAGFSVNSETQEDVIRGIDVNDDWMGSNGDNKGERSQVIYNEGDFFGGKPEFWRG